jgi:photosystem II stability/assembly factor-like uncharacterized protein
MKVIGRVAAACAVALAICHGTVARGATFADPLDVPARPSALASKSLLVGVARAGSRLVAVGQRGHIVGSDDGGATWTQAQVPVSSDLTAVTFVNDSKGWAVGHDGVILNTTDGGRTWSLQLDGRKANAQLVAYMQARGAANPSSSAHKQLLAEAMRFQEQGADKPFLDVWFADESNGYAVGAYNLIVRTADGGKTWEPLFDQTDNAKLLNLYAIGKVGDDLFIAGEAGLVLKLDPATRRFVALDTAYAGSFFGVVGNKDGVLVYGLRGNAYRSADGGTTWSKVDTGLPATIVAGFRATDGAIVLADAGGRIARSADGGRTFAPVKLDRNLPLAGIADAGDGRVARVGPLGVSVAGTAAR